MENKISVEFSSVEFDKILEYMELGNFKTVQEAIIDAVIKETTIKCFRKFLENKTTDDLSISFDKLRHPDIEAIKRRDKMLSEVSDDIDIDITKL